MRFLDVASLGSRDQDYSLRTAAATTSATRGKDIFDRHIQPRGEFPAEIVGHAVALFGPWICHLRRRAVGASSLPPTGSVDWAQSALPPARKANASVANPARSDKPNILTLQRARFGDSRVYGSEAKLMASTLATEVASKAVGICGVHGVTVNSPFGRYLRDAKAYEVGGGSVKILKNTIAKYSSKRNRSLMINELLTIHAAKRAHALLSLLMRAVIASRRFMKLHGDFAKGSQSAD